MLSQAATYADWTTIDTLAIDLGRPCRRVQSSLNGPLARAIKSARPAVPGAQNLIEWQKPAPTAFGNSGNNGGHQMSLQITLFDRV